MPRPSLDHDLWVLLCDAGKAVLFQNAGDAKFPKLEKRAEWEGTNALPHELGSDRPGRTFSGKQGRHSAIEPVDRKRVDERRFLSNVMAETERLVETSRVKRLVLVAPAKTLGELRTSLSAAMTKYVYAEIEKDYLRAPISDIESRLIRLLSRKRQPA